MVDFNHLSGLDNSNTMQIQTCIHHQPLKKFELAVGMLGSIYVLIPVLEKNTIIFYSHVFYSNAKTFHYEVCR